jgi:membrane protein implicated in regulation of membrane protease activity
VNEIEPHWAWLIAAAVLGIAELIMPGVFMIWLAAAAALTGVVALLFDLPAAFQFVVFALFSLASVYAGRRWYHAHPVESSDPLLNDRAARLIGETVVVVGAIENGRGRVAVGDTAWPARGADAVVGARVRVIGADGTCLKVAPLAIAPSEPPPEDAG